MGLTDKITITNEDNMELMARYPDNYFDLAIVDPPYGIGVNMNMGVRAGEKRKHKQKDWDSSIPDVQYFNELKRVTKNQIIWGANNFSNLLPPSSEWVYWDKLITGKVDFSSGELAYTSFNGSLKYFKYAIQSNYILETRIHPTQKPVALYKWLLDKYAKIKCDHKHSEAERYLCTDCNNGKVKILDTHLGSGSIAIACHDYGFELTACELDPEYYDKAIQRIKNHVSQQKLF
jgi:site-specific DNA-methyltransferase (adenine-specific)